MPRSTAAPLFRQYSASVIAAGLGQAVAVAGTFVTIWAGTRLLSKEGFGSYAIAIAIIGMVIIIALEGLDKSIIFRLSSASSRWRGVRRIRAYLWRATRTGIVLGTTLCGIGIGLSQLPSAKPLGQWLMALTGVIAIMPAVHILAEWMRATGRVTTSLYIISAGPIVRSIVLAIAVVAHADASALILAEFAAAIVPLLILCICVPSQIFTHLPAAVPTRDLDYGRKLLSARLIDEGVRRLDLIMVGALASAGAAASYAVAARLSIVAELGRKLTLPAFGPRLRTHLRNDDLRKASAEYRLVAGTDFLLALIGTTGLVALCPHLLPLFGDYADAEPILLLLLAAYICNAGCGPNNAALSLSGAAGTVAAVRALGLGILVALNLVLIPLAGGTGAALGTLIGMAMINALFAYHLAKGPGLPTVDLMRLGALGVVLFSLTLRAGGLIDATSAALLTLIAATEPARILWRARHKQTAAKVN